MSNVRLYEQGIDAICLRIIEGESMTAIAHDLGASAGEMVTWIAADPERSARAKEARAMSAKLWDEKATKLFEDAADPFELAKAKEIAHHYRWRASKIAPREYGEKLELSGNKEQPLIVEIVAPNAGQAAE